MIIGIAEVKPKHFRYSPTAASYNIDGYDKYYKNIENNIGRGVMLYIHKSLNSSEVTIKENYEEGIWAEILLASQDKLLIGVIYRSDSGSVENNMELLSTMQDVSNFKHSHKLIMGDFNFTDIDWNNWNTPHSEDHIEHKFIECVRDTFLFQHVTKPTRGRIGQNPSILDLIFTNEEGMIIIRSGTFKSSWENRSWCTDVQLQLLCRNTVQNQKINTIMIEATMII